MVIREYYTTREDGVILYRTYSDTSHKLRQLETGVIYDEAIDVESANYSYEETDDIIVVPSADILRENGDMAEGGSAD
mgnify:CR=1 FL=1